MIHHVKGVREGIVGSLLIASMSVLACGSVPPPPAGGAVGGLPLEPETRTFEATIVDIDRQAGKLTVKDREGWETWTVAVTTESWLRDDETGEIEIDAFEVGDQIRVIGVVRVPLVITAREIARWTTAGSR